MTVTRSPYAGQTVVFATMHGKELLARESFAALLGATVVAPYGLNTDRFGTFSGEVERTLDPLASARAKARSGMELARGTLGLASEGSFSGGVVSLVEHHELLLFVDVERAIEIVEEEVNLVVTASEQPITSVDEAARFANKIGFPDHGVVLIAQRFTGTRVTKDFGSLHELKSAAEAMLADPHSTVSIQPDHRAHRAPERAAVIRNLSARMARRLATLCPDCGCPGVGAIGAEAGLPCESCGLPTEEVRAQFIGCAACEWQQRIPRDAVSASALYCYWCNP